MLIYTDSIFMRNELLTYCISSNNSWGRLFLFSPYMRKKWGDYSREGDYSIEAIISNIAHWTSCPKYFVLFSHQKIITSNKLNMGFLSVPNLVT